ncbi:MAG TPA: hypothetical protein ENH55_13175 [Aurantimonas coralicida]|uniref:Uncharacterized protein n=2 Tax=root TaxID=1 RepID=A0A9C9NDJ3_9HYPH|nr:hypothetical protein [Aurantimonas coralicida]HET99615.1 hypothetical protein [Aurantimonas coralicida]
MWIILAIFAFASVAPAHASMHNLPSWEAYGTERWLDQQEGDRIFERLQPQPYADPYDGLRSGETGFGVGSQEELTRDPYDYGYR